MSQAGFDVFQDAVSITGVFQKVTNDNVHIVNLLDGIVLRQHIRRRTSNRYSILKDIVASLRHIDLKG